MADNHPDITPRGLSQKDRVDLLYMIVSSLAGIAAKLDADGGVTDETYLENCYTNIFTVKIEDSKGNVTGLTGDHIISPNGISDAALIELLYQIFNSIETMTEQLDADGGVTDVDYEDNCYTAKLAYLVENQKGNVLGNGVVFRFRPGGVTPEKEWVNLMYDLVDAIETLTEQLDADGGVTDANYEALWFTANILLKIENSQGNIVGN